MDETQGTPVEGQSHWCDGKIVVEGSYKKRPCRNIVRNDSDHSAAGHKNRPRPVGFTSVIANDDLVTHVRVRGVPVGGLGSYSLPVTLAFEVGDLAANKRGGMMGTDTRTFPALRQPEPWDMTEAEAEVCYCYMPHVMAVLHEAALGSMGALSEAMRLYRTDGLDQRREAGEGLEQVHAAYDEMRRFGRG